MHEAAIIADIKGTTLQAGGGLGQAELATEIDRLGKESSVNYAI
jgi:hypothetical protein